MIEIHEMLYLTTFGSSFIWGHACVEYVLSDVKESKT